VFVDRLLAEGRTRVLEVGTGPGLDALALAERGLAVRGVDLAPEHVRLARESGVDAYVAPAQRLPFDDATFDAVAVRFGYMFFPDLPRATNEFVRVLEPGGRLCASVWVKPEENPWTTIAMQAIESLTPEDLERTIYIRGKGMLVVEALNS